MPDDPPAGPRVLLDGPAIAAALGLHPGTVRNWASQGRLARRGRAGRRVLYDLDEAIALATRQQDGATHDHPAASDYTSPQ